MAAASAGPSSEGADTTIFLRATFLDARSKKSCLCLRVASHSSTKAFWDSVVEPALANWGGVSPSTELTLLCRGRRVDISPSVSLADIALFAYTHVADEGGFGLGDYPAVERWIERVSQLPDFIPMG